MNSFISLSTQTKKMAMASPNPNPRLLFLYLFLFFFFFLSVSTQSPSPQPSPPSVYDILPEFGLPSGLLPNSVTDYKLFDDGRFAVYLEHECYVEFEYLVYYDKVITGKLGYGSIIELKGIQVQRFWFWFDVDEIKVDLPPSDSIYFQVGIINKRLDVSQFESVHSCRNGVSCLGGSDQLLQLPTTADDIQMLMAV